MKQAIPEGFSTITPTLVLERASEAIALYSKAFGATEDYRMETPDGKVMHACLTVGNSKLFLSDPFPGCDAPTNNSRFYLYMDDVDGACTKAIKAGLQQSMPPEDMFWGDRVGAVTDQYGIQWTLATHVREVSPEEMEKGRQEFFEKMKSGSKPGKAA